MRSLRELLRSLRELLRSLRELLRSLRELLRSLREPLRFSTSLAEDRAKSPTVFGRSYLRLTPETLRNQRWSLVIDSAFPQN
ncbi:hypothetical protein [Candidatus Laterigemmans baculatus]|uniref:hypothetical protein n=1 Tax=Candidatus Laterigemmans baculatus TaxID=2770505 RepID=UPI0013DCD36C|nr:hypothetical protein [Candidatus Laterigemmans baculatus]